MALDRKRKDVGMILHCKDGNIIIMKCLLDQFSHTAGKFIHVHDVRDLRADFTHKIQLVEPEAFHCDAMRGNQADCNHTGQPFSRSSSSCLNSGPLGRVTCNAPSTIPCSSSGTAAQVCTCEALFLPLASVLCATCRTSMARCIPCNEGCFREKRFLLLDLAGGTNSPAAKHPHAPPPDAKS